MKKERVNDKFLNDVLGVIHVGASRGQEMSLYEKKSLNVVWIEPIPEVFTILKRNLQGKSKQIAFQNLITDKDGKKYKFRISNNRGESSSILDLELVKVLWPNIFYVKTILLRSITLASLCKKEKIDISKYDGLVLDTQGSEMLVLKGAIPILDNFRYIQVEASDCDLYKGGCRLAEIEAFMGDHGYKEVLRHRHLTHHEPYHCYDIVYKKNAQL